MPPSEDFRATVLDVIMSSALEAYGHRSKAQPDWFRDNVDLLPTVAAKISNRFFGMGKIIYSCITPTAQMSRTRYYLRA